MRRPSGIVQILRQFPLLAFAVLILFPFVMIFFAAFKTDAAVYMAPYNAPHPWSLAAFRTLFHGGQMFLYFRNSTIVTSSAIVLSIVLGSMMAYGLYRMGRFWGNLLWAVVSFGIMVPTQVNMVSLYIEFDKLNLLNSLFGLVIVDCTFLLPVTVFIVGGYLKTLPYGLLEAAQIDGASEWMLFLRIVTPLSGAAIATVAIFSLVMSWNDLLYPLLFIQSKGLQTLPLALLHFQGQYLTNYPALFAGVLISAIPIVILYVIFQRFFMEGLTAGSIKG
ncbi:carbohydrate ABC transporter permease [Alicyclobacillus sp. SO9]|uniref:carbohydrate ABC transporter permease n=1 Tax=Alicyclobacillus sp. SO9 TaxID=2665646 RepID=UPI0018E78701|nr:carbohydrate ABC transporter permease [Alicyclobacillus sp. SO9]QQE80478.1 carbohydrate ABC transporter permease [Alicyclobacillus sp. SO9]